MRTNGLPTKQRLRAATTGLILAIGATLAAPASAQYWNREPQTWWQSSYSGDNTGPEPGDAFGSALAAGDFDGDGFEDLAIGAPGETLGGAANSGSAEVLYGSASGLSYDLAHSVDAVWHGVEFWPIEGRFGAALAAGDFDLDGIDDLVLGIPGLNAFQFILGSRTVGLRTLRNTFFELSQIAAPRPASSFGQAVVAGNFDGIGAPEIAVSDPTNDNGGTVYILKPRFSDDSFVLLGILRLGLITSSVQANAGFGQALAVGDFNHDGRDDLAVGAPYRTVGGATGAGAAWIFFGGSSGLDPARRALLTQGAPASASYPESNDLFGASLATGDVNGDGYDDLAVGAPGEMFPALLGSPYTNAGAVSLFHGHAAGISTNSAIVLDQKKAGVGVLETNDRFGAALLLLDTNGDHRAELFVGVPGEDEARGATQGFNAGPGGISASGSALLMSIWSPLFILPGDRFGSAFAAGDFDGDGSRDLAAGVPGDSFRGHVGEGRVNTYPTELPLVFQP